MGKVKYQFPVADVCGKIDKNSRVIFAHRGDTKFTVMQGDRSTPATENELRQRALFKTAVVNTRARLKDPDNLLADQTAFAKQTKYKTLYQFVFNAELVLVMNASAATAIFTPSLHDALTIYH